MGRFLFLELAIMGVILGSQVFSCTSNETDARPSTAGRPARTREDGQCSMTTDKSVFLVPGRVTNDCVGQVTISVPRALESAGERCKIISKPTLSPVQFGYIELAFVSKCEQMTYDVANNTDVVTCCVVVESVKTHTSPSENGNKERKIISKPRYDHVACVPFDNSSCNIEVSMQLDQHPEVKFDLSIVGVNASSKSGARNELGTSNKTTAGINVCCGAACGGIEEEVGLGLGTLRRSGDRAVIEVTAVDRDDELLLESVATQSVNLTTKLSIRVTSSSSTALADEPNAFGKSTSEASSAVPYSDSGIGLKAGGGETEKAELRQKQEQKRNAKLSEAVSGAMKVSLVSRWMQRVEIERDELCSAIGKSMGRGSSRVVNQVVEAQQRQSDFGDGNEWRWNEDGGFCLRLEVEIEATATSRQLDFDEKSTTSKWVQIFPVGSGTQADSNRTREDEAAASREDGEGKRKRGVRFCSSESESDSRGCRGETCASSNTTQASNDSILGTENNKQSIWVIFAAVGLLLLALAVLCWRLRRNKRRYDSNNHNQNGNLHQNRTPMDEATEEAAEQHQVFAIDLSGTSTHFKNGAKKFKQWRDTLH